MNRLSEVLNVVPGKHSNAKFGYSISTRTPHTFNKSARMDNGYYVSYEERIIYEDGACVVALYGTDVLYLYTNEASIDSVDALPSEITSLLILMRAF